MRRSKRAVTDRARRSTASRSRRALRISGVTDTTRSPMSALDIRSRSNVARRVAPGVKPG